MSSNKTDANGYIVAGQHMQPMRQQMETKELLKNYGDMYIGTGKQVSDGNNGYSAVTTNLPFPIDKIGSNTNFKIVADNSNADNTFGGVGWRDVFSGKITITAGISDYKFNDTFNGHVIDSSKVSLFGCNSGELYNKIFDCGEIQITIGSNEAGTALADHLNAGHKVIVLINGKPLTIRRPIYFYTIPGYTPKSYFLNGDIIKGYYFIKPSNGQEGKEGDIYLTGNITQGIQYSDYVCNSAYYYSIDYVWLCGTAIDNSGVEIICDIQEMEIEKATEFKQFLLNSEIKNLYDLLEKKIDVRNIWGPATKMPGVRNAQVYTLGAFAGCRLKCNPINNTLEKTSETYEVKLINAAAFLTTTKDNPTGFTSLLTDEAKDVLDSHDKLYVTSISSTEDIYSPTNIVHFNRYHDEQGKKIMDNGYYPSFIIKEGE